MKNLKLNVIEKNTCRGSIEVREKIENYDIEKIDEVFKSLNFVGLDRDDVLDLLEKNLLEKDFDFCCDVIIESCWSNNFSDNCILENGNFVKINWLVFDGSIIFFEGEDIEKFFKKI